MCLGDSKIAGPAILELYEEVMLNLIPKRYPTIFRISGDVFENLVTGSRHSIAKARSDPRAMLRKIAENVEEDFYFMVPNADGEFVLQGFVACFPQGLLPAAKVGMTVSEIHKPVPDYEGRLQKGVNRCFARLGQGESIDRYNVCSSQARMLKVIMLTTYSGPSNQIITSCSSHSKVPTPSKATIAHPSM